MSEPIEEFNKWLKDEIQKVHQRAAIVVTLDQMRRLAICAYGQGYLDGINQRHGKAYAEKLESEIPK